MDTLRGNFGGLDAPHDDDVRHDDVGHDPMPPMIGTDERRMQVRAYNFWAGLLEDRNFPSVEDLEPDELTDFGPYGVLLDFSKGIEDPLVSYLGAKLADECAAAGTVINRLSDVPARSLLSRITDHYMQILANQAPIGFEAEFVNQRGATILYRGILLPFSSDDETIDFIFGVINWKEMAEPQAADELLLEIDHSLDAPSPPLADMPMADWADGPGAEQPAVGTPNSPGVLPVPSFGLLNDDEDEEDDSEPYAFVRDEIAAPEPAPASAFVPVSASPLSSAMDEADMELADWLAAARELAVEAGDSEDRSRAALYAAIGRAHDFALAAAQQPQNYAELLEDAGLTVQERAPMTPVVKLVFGAEYDKTRLTEYAAALMHANRLGLARGALADFLRQAPGGLKGVVAEERRLRRADDGAAPRPRKTATDKLRKLAARDFSSIAPEGEEFALVMVRRTGHGEVVVLGEVPADEALVERAARKLVG
jgi:hypothetical protein